MDVGPAELVIILVIVLLLFGTAKLPKLARSLRQAHKEFKQGLAEGQRSDNTDTGERESPVTTDASASR
jgi:sec-independent protein translocase protein TatA